MSNPEEIEEIELSPAELEAKIAKLKRRFLRSFIVFDLCLILILLDKYTDVIQIGWIIPLILLIISFFAAIGFYGQFRTLEQKRT